MRIKITVSYKGTNYCGFQIQQNGNTVQEELENAIYKITGEKSTVIPSGRTDSGVHALGQVAHFDTNSNIPPEKFTSALNAYLPKDIRVQKSEPANVNFHARYSAKRKTYCYTYYFAEQDNPLISEFCERVNKPLNIELMKKAALYLKGTHDFAGFTNTGSFVNNTVRTLYNIKIKTEKEEIEKVKIYINGNGFLYNMVRIIASTLKDVGLGKKPPQIIKNIIQTGNRNLASPTAPPNGLCLLFVEYDI